MSLDSKVNQYFYNLPL